MFSGLEAKTDVNGKDITGDKIHVTLKPQFIPKAFHSNGMVFLYFMIAAGVDEW